MEEGGVRVVQLEEGDRNDVVYRIQKGTSVEFRLSPSLHGHAVVLFTNCPASPGESFTRTAFRELGWAKDDHNEETVANLKASLSGNFQYYFTKEGVKVGSGYFLVDPVLRTGKDDKVLNLDAICCQTVFPKSLGKLTEWKGRLEVSYQSGYNMIHFTPVQKLGASNSSYSIADQLALNPIFGKASFVDVKKIVDELRVEWGMLSICDVVFNHTANETPWLKTNPECGYNLLNCPHLRPAYLLDSLLAQFSYDISQEKYADKGLPSHINTEHHLSVVRQLLKNELLPSVRIEECYMTNVDELVSQFEILVKANPAEFSHPQEDESKLVIVQDKEYRRLKSTTDLQLALKIYNLKGSNEDENSSRSRASSSFRSRLNQLNEGIRGVIGSHLTSAVENVISGARYERLQEDGLKLAQVTDKDPFTHRYFEKVGLPKREELSVEEKTTFGDNCRFILAHNGWVMTDDPLKNFAEAGSNVYLRRELIVWSDSVKLRYGADPSECSFLWNIMKSYVETTAKVFHGLRLDNCHSTPIHVAEYLIDAARNVRPDLYVVAELFTNSDITDNIFVNRLGITSLIREAMSAWDCKEEGRLVHRYGGLPVGAFSQEVVRPLTPAIAHAMFMDQTHDNPSPTEKRSVYDILPTAALVSMASCASGSSRGLDELVPHHIHVVHESRMYSSWSKKADKAGLVNLDTGIIHAKSVINKLHSKLADEGFVEVYVDQMEGDIIAVTRHHPDNHVRVVLVAYTAFNNPDPHFHRSGGIKDLVFEGELVQVIFEAQVQPKDKYSHRSGGSFAKPKGFLQDPSYINGLQNYECTLREGITIKDSQLVKLEGSVVKFVNFQPGSVIAFRINPPPSVGKAITSLKKCLDKSVVEEVLKPLSLTDYNHILYRCEDEERDTLGTGAYTIPDLGTLVYCGLQGVISVLGEVRIKNDTGHPICNNLRAGNWLMDYTAGRLLLRAETKGLGSYLQKCFESVNEFPRYLVPRYFDIVIRRIYIHSLELCWQKMSRFVSGSSTFTKALSLGSVQCIGFTKSGPLPLYGPSKTDLQGHDSLCAGLTHFSTGYMRTWGRDTFISLPGLVILTGRKDDARNHILGYASVLRHGLIPNLLDRGINSRYNCRDATWFWLQAIKVYIENVPKGEEILKESVSRMWPNDVGQPVLDHSVKQPLEDVMQETLTKHFQGINFRERNAGERIDAHMKDEGFSVVAGIDKNTGFVYGGNAWNCGTWMDKMGSSEKSGNKGVPATPRDGSAVELVGLAASVVKFLSELNAVGKFSYNSVEARGDQGKAAVFPCQQIKWTFSEWYEKIRLNFESKFWIPLDPDESTGDPTSHLINRRGIYKDTHGASSTYSDYQLRPNFLVAMTVAPDLFTLKNGIVALEACKTILLSELGMKTLDTSDWNYNGNYENSNDSSDRKVAHGFNYHNGPEWLWPVGFYLRAYLNFNIKGGSKVEALMHVKQVLSRHWRYLQSTPWKGLPELTNKNGAECSGSCRVQAWSMATLLEFLKDVESLEEEK